uniref:Uncharacterized protein n=1 Tax=Plectus sambesii TaxID=2011161 RepID=A0A914W6Q2_9BILA
MYWSTVCGFLLIAVLTTTAQALTCYSCAGSDYTPSVMESALSQLGNISTIPGAKELMPCANNGSFCSNGTFCVKHAIKRSLAKNGTITKTINKKKTTATGLTTYSQSIYTKGCSSETKVTPQNSNQAIPIVSGECYTLSTSVMYGVTIETINCYCNDGDLCNGANRHTTGVEGFVVIAIAFISYFFNQ